MPKKGHKLSEEQKAKMAEGRRKAKAAREAKEATQLQEPATQDEVEEVNTGSEVKSKLKAPEIDRDELVEIILNMQKQMAQLTNANPNAANASAEAKLETTAHIAGARVGKQGVQGMEMKYPVAKDYYPDPTDRLLSETSLQRFAMKDNYVFRWEVTGETYEKYGITYTEPRFTLELFRRLYDDNGEENGKMALVARTMLHEDELTTRVSAQRLGIIDKFGDDEVGFRKLMDEIRYWRMQQWLLGLFRPPEIEQHKNRSTQQVIDGKLVEVFDTESVIGSEKGSDTANSIKRDSGVGSLKIPS